MNGYAIGQPTTDLVIEQIAKYVSEYEIHSRLAWKTFHVFSQKNVQRLFSPHARVASI